MRKKHGENVIRSFGLKYNNYQNDLKTGEISKSTFYTYPRFNYKT